MADYQKKSEEFLTKTGTTFKAVFLENGLYFDDDKETRDIYEITLKRKERSYTFKFGQSIAHSGLFSLKFEAPNAYDVLSCLQKYDIGTFEDFCADFGYDGDSRKAEKTYKAIVEEYNNLKMLYSEAELEKLREIE